MSLGLLSFLFTFFLVLFWFFYPFIKPRRASLPVLLIRDIQTNICSVPKEACRLAQLEHILQYLSSQGFESVLPQEVISPKVSTKQPVMLLFAGGYQSFYTQVFPLLKKYNFKAAVALPVALIGQYNAWLAAEKGLWQNILTEEQIKELQKSGLVEFISGGLNGSALSSSEKEKNIFELTESKYRLNKIYGIDAKALLFPLTDPVSNDVYKTATENYPLVFTNKIGSNYWPLNTVILKTYPITRFTLLPRLFFKLLRS